MIYSAIENGDPMDKLSDFFIPKKTSIIEIGGKLKRNFISLSPKDGNCVGTMRWRPRSIFQNKGNYTKWGMVCT